MKINEKRVMKLLELTFFTISGLNLLIAGIGLIIMILFTIAYLSQ
ncbi:hypothetical protein [Sporosarcina sp. ANT_H38]|nr:hypothetical protein [Sporosarcina sp. ANT_H38]